MNPKNTWLWVVIAAGLLAFILFFERHLHPLPEGPLKLLPELKAAAVKSLQIQPAGQLPIRLERTNAQWRLTEPVVYPAQTATIESLLAALENLGPDLFITAAEMKEHPKPNEEYGFNPPQISLILGQGNQESRVWIGARTPPGNQLYVQVVGTEGIYVVDAGLLQRIPRAANDWRDPALVDLSRIVFDRLMVTNAGKILDLQYNSASKLWRMVFPNDTRADSLKVEEALLRLHSLRALEFVTDDPKADLDAFGLQTPELSLAFKLGTNNAQVFSFGKSPTNHPALVYARRFGLNSVITVSREALEPWRAAHDYRDFFDRHLVFAARPPELIEVQAQDRFTLQRETNHTWRILPQEFPVDAGLVSEVISNLAVMQYLEIAKRVVTPPDLPVYGLDAPARSYVLRAARPDAAGTATDSLIARLDFGLKDDKVFAMRAGESSVYAINTNDLQLLPFASWQMRERRLWDFAAADAARITIRQGGKTRELVRAGTNRWSLAPGSQGILDEVVIEAIEETVHRLGELAAAAWLARGEQNRAGLGFTPEGWQIAIELKNGRKFSVEFGGFVPSGFPAAATVLDGEPWFFEFPLSTYNLAATYLAIPADLPLMVVPPSGGRAAAEPANAGTTNGPAPVSGSGTNTELP